MAGVDVVVLCLPDEAAKETVALADSLPGGGPRILDASTAHRILSVLAQNRMVERVGAGSYRLGLRLRELGRRVQDSQTAIPPAQP